jgi:hypothetical protein
MCSSLINIDYIFCVSQTSPPIEGQNKLPSMFWMISIFFLYYFDLKPNFLIKSLLTHGNFLHHTIPPLVPKYTSNTPLGYQPNNQILFIIIVWTRQWPLGRLSEAVGC